MMRAHYQAIFIQVNKLISYDRTQFTAYIRAMTMAMATANVRPLTTSFTPTLWADTFTTFSFDHQLQEKYGEDIEAMKKEARVILMAATSAKLIALVDKLERLGLAFHFEEEIQHKLQQVYDAQEQDHDLFTTALRFRLLRQHQYHVSCRVFDKFVEGDNKFKECVGSDVEGLLSLYEAAQVRIHEENVLEEAAAFTVHRLNRILPELENSSIIKEKVQLALNQSIHRSVVILTVRFYISLYEGDGSTEEVLMKLAKLNFNYLQNMYKKEISQLTRWWKEFDLKSKLPYARDRVVESYFMGMSFRFEPQYSCVRRDVAKSVLLVTIVDDTYDNYATLEEAQLFTDIVQRWDLKEIDVLPDCMKIVYRFIMSIFEEYKVEAATHEKPFAVPYFKEAVKQLCRAYNEELKWVMERQMPSFEEFMRNSVIRTSVYVMYTVFAPTMKSVTQQTLQWLLSEPKILISICTLGRHLQDLASHERESKEGKVLTVVDCYMKDKNATKEEALSKFGEFIENGWKVANEEWVKKDNVVPKIFVETLVNLGRTVEVLYNNDQDGFTCPEELLAPQLTPLYVDPPLL
uniref:Terpene synthase 3 n=1 Tax=Prunella vulgaris TaxID=39358 RepID=A0A6B7LAF0_PRUVU|nr:terpene synthase 3 [Prunella vulgaris]